MATKEKVRYAFKIVGQLGHDNKLFDRTCSTCKGMYSSHERGNCPKCNKPLTYITGADGQPISISEGTVYPAFGDKQLKKDIAEMTSRRNGMPIKYRFKMFHFIDEHGVLVPPPEHSRCRSGAKVEIVTMNHQIVVSWFMGKDKQNPESKAKIPWVEFMILVYTNYGDHVKMLTEAEYASMVIHHEVNADGTPAPMSGSLQDQVTQLQAEIARLQGLTPPTQPAVVSAESTPPWDTEVKTVAVNESIPDPFKMVKG